MNEFGVGIIGNGGIYGLAHGPAWQRIPRAKVVATCDIIEERAQQAATQSGAQHYGTQAEELIGNESVDIVDICTPSDTHVNLAVQALEAGKHVICEKPMALQPQQSARLMQVAAKAKGHLYIGHTRRFDARWLSMKEQITAGRIGAPTAIRRSERCWGGFPSAEDWHWDLNRSGGVLMDLGIHIADLFAWFMDAEAEQVYAKGLTIREEARTKKCFDFALVQVSYRNGKRGLMEMSWAYPKEYAPYYSATEVIGTLGKLTLTDKDTAPMTVVKGGISVPRYSTLLSSFPETFVVELNHFLDCIEGAAEPRITVRDAHHAVHVIHAAMKSIATDQPIRLSEEASNA